MLYASVVSSLATTFQARVTLSNNLQDLEPEDGYPCPRSRPEKSKQYLVMIPEAQILSVRQVIKSIIQVHRIGTPILFL